MLMNRNYEEASSMLRVRLLPYWGAAFCITALLVSMIFFPAEALSASLRGLSIWWDILFPALLPFFVIAELMLGFGLVHFFGTFFDPMMRPLFRVPGIGGFVMAMGFASGYPVGSKLTAQLWDHRLISREEGERLVSFTTTADPIFLIGAVSVGFFHDPGLAVIFAVAHYGGAVILGLIMRFHGKKEFEGTVEPTQGSLLFRALRAMHHARIQDGRPLGVLLEQAVTSSLKLIIVIGGLVVFISVVMEMLTQAHLMGMLVSFIDMLLQAIGIPVSLTQAVVNGLFEVTLGAKAAGEAGESTPLIGKAAIGAFVLSWAGLSVHAQILSILNHTDIRYMPFLLSRFLHGCISAILVFLIWGPMQPLRSKVQTIAPAWSPGMPGTEAVASFISWSAICFGATALFILLLYGGYRIARGARRIIG
jgi:sporulation integral membrane protein YlbJ